MNQNDYSEQLAEELITLLSTYLVTRYPAEGETINQAERSLDRTILAHTLIKLIDERIRLTMKGGSSASFPPPFPPLSI